MAERLQSLIQIHLVPLHVVSIAGPGSDFHERKTPDWLSDDRCFYLDKSQKIETLLAQ